MAKILILEDEKNIAEGLRINLEAKGHFVVVAANGKEGLEKFETAKFQLIVLDLMMPVMDGHEFLDRVREKTARLPILILSAKDSGRDKVRCFKAGVDDYLTKPFDLEEFLLRVERLLIRDSWSKENPARLETPEEIAFGANSVNFTTGLARGQEGEFRPTEQELRLLRVFSENPDIPLSRDFLLSEAWGYNEGTHSRTLDNFIVRFRKYFELDPKNPIHFQSIRSKGYLFSYGK